ncbi:MAG: LamG domain-containing protein, partial [Planctomycetota bacterium]
ISATHTHSAAAAMGCLGTEADPKYVPFLRLKVAESLAAAEQRLEPARVGWGVVDAAEYTALRQWVRRPDRLEKDPFGNLSVRANMHAGRVWDDVTGEAGPEDPDLSLISIQARDGRPLAVLANFSMHYFSDAAISADYFGLFCTAIEKAASVQVPAGKPAFVAIMSHGCSGDIWRRDYTQPIPKPADDFTIESYATALAQLAQGVLPKIVHRDDADLAMSETRLRLRYRVPDAQRLEWARRIVEAMGERPPKDTTEVYAREQLLLHQRQSTEVVVQGLRIGDIAIATTPNETYALTGLKLKLQSPLTKTMVIELANGGDGYIPPAEQHPLGGYNTWAARSAGLETGAEAKITAAALAQLEAVAGQPRRVHRAAIGPATQAVLDARPIAYWRLDEFGPSRARDSSGHHRDAFYEPGVLFFLEGPRSQRFLGDGQRNRAAFFAGGRLEARLADVGDRFKVSLWLWNGMPIDARPIAGWLFGRGDDQRLTPDCLGLGLASPELLSQSVATGAGTAVPTAKPPAAPTPTATTRLCLAFGADGPDSSASRLRLGKTAVARWSWHHVALVRDGDTVRVHLDGAAEPELVAHWPIPAETGVPAAVVNRQSERFFFGGRPDGADNWEGRLDEISVFDRVLTPAELATIGK